MNILLANIQQSTDIDSISVLIIIVIFMALIFGWVLNRITLLRIRQNTERTKDLSTIMQRTLSTSNNFVVRLNLQKNIAVNLHGNFLPDGGMSYEESLNYIHPEDRQIYVDFLRSITHGNKTAECTFRWDRSTSKHEGDWRYIHDVGIAEYAGNQKIPLNILCTLTDKTEETLKEQEEQSLTDRYRLFFEQGIAGLAFYDKDGQLLYANEKMREILKFQSEHDPYYYNRTLYDLPTLRYVLDNRQAEELYFCTRSVVVERGVNCYTELRVHPIYDDSQQLVYISFSIRDITKERELYLQNKKNEIELRQANENIKRLETELQYLMDTCDMRFFKISTSDMTCTFYKGMSQAESALTLSELSKHFEDSPFRQGLADYKNYFSVPRTDLTHMHPLFHEGTELQWNFIDSVPYFGADGEMLGSYGIVRNVTDLIEKQERLKEETERANESGLKKSTFMANMTHEIRTPLNAIVGFSDVLPMLSTPEEKQEIIKVIMNNCDMLLRLVNDILAISSLSAGSIEIIPAKVDFAKEFDCTCISLAQRVQNPNVAFVKDNPLETFVTELDYGRIQQVITNFVTNAVKYTQQGHIKVGYKLEERAGKHGLYLYCEDTGAGIPKEDQAKVFERFVKLNDFVQGTGLGLSICKAIADNCQGEIGLFSEGEGHGSTFWLWIPCEEVKHQN